MAEQCGLTMLLMFTVRNYKVNGTKNMPHVLNAVCTIYTPKFHSGVLRLATLDIFKWLPKKAFILTLTWTLPLDS